MYYQVNWKIKNKTVTVTTTKKKRKKKRNSNKEIIEKSRTVTSCSLTMEWYWGILARGHGSTDQTQQCQYKKILRSNIPQYSLRK